MFVAYIIEMQRGGNPRTVATFVNPVEGDASHWAGMIMDRLVDDTGRRFSYHVEPIEPVLNADDALRLAEAVIAEGM